MGNTLLNKCKINGEEEKYPNDWNLLRNDNVSESSFRPPRIPTIPLGLLGLLRYQQTIETHNVKQQ